MKKNIVFMILSVLCLSNLGMTFADSNVKQIPTPVLYNDEVPEPVLISEENPVPVLISTDSTPVLISDNSDVKWLFKEKREIAKDRPIFKDGTIYLPLREVAETMDFNVAWNSVDRSVDITKDDFVSKMYLGNMQYNVNESSGQFKEYPKVIQDKTFLAQADIESLFEVSTTVQDNNISLNPKDMIADEYGYTGTIKDLKFEEHGATVYLEGDTTDEMIDDLIVRVHFETEIENGSFKDFKIGTVLDVQYSISTRSIPAQTNAEKIRVVKTPELYTTYKGKVKEVVENDRGFSIHLTKGDENYMNDLIVNIQKGSYMESEMYELDGKTITVEYTISTMSIPAQTSPIKILVAR